MICDFIWADIVQMNLSHRPKSYVNASNCGEANEVAGDSKQANK